MVSREQFQSELDRLGRHDILRGLKIRDLDKKSRQMLDLILCTYLKIFLLLVLYFYISY